MLMNDSTFILLLTYLLKVFLIRILIACHTSPCLTTFACIIDFGKWEEEILASKSTARAAICSRW